MAHVSPNDSVPQSVVYDKAKYHFGGDFPAELPEQQAFVHTAMFLGWIMDLDLYSDDFAGESAEQIARFKARQLKASVVYEWWDGCLVDDMLNSEGNAFAQDYFDFEKGKYLADYEELLATGMPSLYHVSETWENYERLRLRIDQRYREWQRRRTKKPWQFWR